jgi:hypothetical protein
MARPTSADLQRSLKALTTLSERDINSIVHKGDDPAKVADRLHEVMPRLLDRYGSAAAAVAADWYDNYRATVATKTRFEASPAVPKVDEASAVVGAGSPHLFGENADRTVASRLISGALTTRILDAARETITESSIADPAAQGWQRVADAGACGFCLMLESRGEVYTEDSADFASHDHCGCSAEPAFEGEPIPVQPYTPSEARISDTDRARAKSWIKANL